MNPIIQIPLTQGYATTISPEDADLAQVKWTASARAKDSVYACRDIKPDGKKQRLYLHRVIMERKIGDDIPEGMVVDHVNRNSLDNTRDNLRLATTAQNIANSRRMRKKHRRLQSPYRGVYWIDAKRKWRSQISIKRKTVYLGYFDSAEKAAAAYNKAALEHRSKFARLNQVPSGDGA